MLPTKVSKSINKIDFSIYVSAEFQNKLIFNGNPASQSVI